MIKIKNVKPDSNDDLENEVSLNIIENYKFEEIISNEEDI